MLIIAQGRYFSKIFFLRCSEIYLSKDMIKFLIVYKVKTKYMHKKVPLSFLSHMM